jgi:5-methylcytosine-specific restriction endonuclease McrA
MTLERRDDVYPLASFPEEYREAIARAVAAPTPPEKWLHLGPFLPDGRWTAAIPSRAWYEWHWARGIDPDAKRERLNPWLRVQVIERDGYVCGLCGDDVDPDDVHIDHIMPWSRGGKHELSNLQVAHSTCNLRKGNRV